MTLCSARRASCSPELVVPVLESQRGICILSPNAAKFLQLNIPRREVSAGTVHTLPSDLKKALAADKAALASWEDITSLARNEWICWVESVKRPETRREHVERACAQLKEGKRRPCCWIGCIHRPDKPISPSVQWVLSRRSRKKS
jgi:hypothetical protein